MTSILLFYYPQKCDNILWHVTNHKVVHGTSTSWKWNYIRYWKNNHLKCFLYFVILKKKKKKITLFIYLRFLYFIFKVCLIKTIKNDFCLAICSKFYFIKLIYFTSFNLNFEFFYSLLYIFSLFNLKWADFLWFLLRFLQYIFLLTGHK